MKTLEPRLRRFLNTWQLWMGVAFVGQIAVIVALVVVSNRTNQTSLQVLREQTIHQAQVRAAGDSAYTECLRSIPELARISRHLRGVNQLAAAVTANAKALMDATAPTDPSYAVRRHNYERVRVATEKIAAVRALPIPTRKECAARKRSILASGGVS